MGQPIVRELVIMMPDHKHLRLNILAFFGIRLVLTLVKTDPYDFDRIYRSEKRIGGNVVAKAQMLVDGNIHRAVDEALPTLLRGYSVEDRAMVRPIILRMALGLL